MHEKTKKRWVSIVTILVMVIVSIFSSSTVESKASTQEEPEIESYLTEIGFAVGETFTPKDILNTIVLKNFELGYWVNIISLDINNSVIVKRLNGMDTVFEAVQEGAVSVRIQIKDINCEVLSDKEYSIPIQKDYVVKGVEFLKYLFSEEYLTVDGEMCSGHGKRGAQKKQCKNCSLRQMLKKFNMPVKEIINCYTCYMGERLFFQILFGCPECDTNYTRTYNPRVGNAVKFYKKGSFYHSGLYLGETENEYILLHCNWSKQNYCEISAVKKTSKNFDEVRFFEAKNHNEIATKGIDIDLFLKIKEIQKK